MKNKLGYYVLSKKDTKALHTAIEKTFEFDVPDNYTVVSDFADLVFVKDKSPTRLGNGYQTTES